MEGKKPKLLEIRPTKQNDPISIEVTDVEGESKLALAEGKKSFEEMLQGVKPFCESIISNFSSLNKKPTSASVEFGVKLSSEGHLFIVNAFGDATLKVSLTWCNKSE